MKEGIFGKETIFVKLNVLPGVISFAFYWDNSVPLKCNKLLWNSLTLPLAFPIIYSQYM